MREGGLDAPIRHVIPWEDPDFFDRVKTEAEMRRIFDICHGCRRCFNLCDAFPRLFDLVDNSDTGELDGVAVADYQKVADACTLCDMCFMTKCPYVPPHEFNVDFPHVMLRYRAVERREGERISAAEVRRRYDLPRNVLERLAELGVLSPNSRGYDADDVKIIEAISRFRAGGYDERLGFTVYETLRYREALEPLVQEEVRTLLDRLAGEVEPDRAADIIASGAEPLRELIGAMHSKMLLAELRRQHGRG